MLLIAGLLAGTFYWNDQLSFGVDVPPKFPRCTGVADAPDRGIYVLLNKNESCPDLKNEGLPDYVERKGISAVAIIAWYNTVEEFNDSLELAGAYCRDRSQVRKKKMKYGDVYYCFTSAGKNTSLNGFVQLHKNDQRMAAVNIQFRLYGFRKEHTRAYWRMVESLVAARPKD